MQRQFATLLVALAIVGCSRRVTPNPLSQREIWNSAYKTSWIGEEAGVRLMNGAWDGATENGEITHPYVRAVDLVAEGDIDHDGVKEAAVLMDESGGGSGIVRVLAVYGRVGGRPENMASVMLGDRVKVKSVALVPGQLSAVVIRQGDGDPLCCPSEIVEMTWNYSKKAFILSSERILGKLNPAFLTNTTWRLMPHNPGADITLTYRDGNFTGSAGCNEYSAPAKPGDLGGEISIGSIISIRRACSPITMQAEHDFLLRLQRVSAMSFFQDHLWLSYTPGDGKNEKDDGSLEFELQKAMFITP